MEKYQNDLFYFLLVIEDEGIDIFQFLMTETRFKNIGKLIT